MNLIVLAVGKATKSPERDLCARYIGRLERIGRQLGIASVDVREVPDAAGPQRQAQESEKLLALRRQGPLVVLDERAAPLPSEAFAERVQGYIDGGTQNLTFAIGGADGHAPALRAEADWLLGFGPMTLPHLLVRVLLLEQLYRAVTIRLGHPYHRA